VGAFSALATFGLGAGTRLGLDIFNTVRNEPQSDQASAAGRDGNIANPLPKNLEGDRNNPAEARKAENAREAADVARDRTDRMSSTSKGWLAFLALLLPLLAAIGGALAGCGEDPTRRIRRNELPPVQVENRLTQYERTGA